MNDEDLAALLVGNVFGGVSDTTAPTCVITCDQTSPSSAATFTFTYTCSEDTTDFDVNTPTIAGGTKGTFTPVSAKVYTLVVTPTAYEVTADVAANAFHDAAGNGNTAATQFPMSALVKWYLAGAIPAANCIISYQPIGAASYAASKVNLANPGTYNATDPGADPSFNAATGWTFNSASAQYLLTGYVPPNQVTRSAIVKISGASTEAAGHFVFSSRNGAAFFSIQNTNAASRAVFQNGTGTAYTHSTNISAGVLAIAGLDAYIDGVDVGNITAGTYDQGAVEIGLGVLWSTGSQYFTGNKQVFAFYDITLTPTQITALTTAINALP